MQVRGGSVPLSFRDKAESSDGPQQFRSQAMDGSPPLLELRVLVQAQLAPGFPLEVLHRVGHRDRSTIEPDDLKCFIQQLSGWSDERMPGPILDVAWLFSESMRETSELSLHRTPSGLPAHGDGTLRSAWPQLVMSRCCACQQANRPRHSQGGRTRFGANQGRACSIVNDASRLVGTRVGRSPAWSAARAKRWASRTAQPPWSLLKYTYTSSVWSHKSATRAAQLARAVRP